jgi:hypothetical protein
LLLPVGDGIVVKLRVDLEGAHAVNEGKQVNVSAGSLHN